MKTSVQEILDLQIDIGMSTDDEVVDENKNTKQKEHYHLEVENEDPEDRGYLAPSISILRRSSSRYSLRRRPSKRSISVSKMISLDRKT